MLTTGEIFIILFLVWSFQFNSCDFLKAIGLQELLINPDFNSFIDWFGDVTKENILTTGEILKCNEDKGNGSFINDVDRINNEIDRIFKKIPCNDGAVEDRQGEFEDLKESEKLFENLLSRANGTDIKLDVELNRLNSENNILVINEEALIENCKDSAMILEKLRVKNIENRNNLFNSFTNQQSTPLRWCQIDLDNYCINCDNVALSLKLRFEQKLKLTNFVDMDDQNARRLYHIQNVETVILRKSSAKFEMEFDLEKVNALIEILSKPFEPIGYATMSSQTERLSWQNQEIEENIENLEASINEKLKHLAFQEAKFCEIACNREKHKTAEKRLEILKRVRKPILDNLLLADILWVSLHMEKEEMKKMLENISVARYEDENKQCARNMQILTKISGISADDHVTEEFLNKVTDVILGDARSNRKESSDADNCIEMYNEATINHDLLLQHIISDSYQLEIINVINDFNLLSQEMNSIIGNGPLDKPNLWNLPIVADLEVYKRKFELLFESSRSMRRSFMEKYHQPFTNDELWRRRHFLWIWFLTDEKSFLEAFQNTIGDKSISRSRITSLGGLRRQQ